MTDFPEIGVTMKYDEVDRPQHYNSGGIEVMDALEAWGLHQDFCLGNAVKYIARAGKKTECPITDLRKAVWYIERKLKNLVKERAGGTGNA